MNLSEIIEKNKDQILPDFYEWVETFEHEFDDDGERTMEPYNTVYSLAKRLEENQCTEENYEEILFHIEQINYNEIKIKL